ncbi:MAG: tRNA uridine-5-carboxymethylaminomethyl(34) synthesis GTPase MnmE [Sphaerochaetaceae bacterium]|nr:tRNA uridine-5-carboxymethylaminomethyl(34) synthesis GTPase MnmE [Sphaerochaetaceae bacterium]
MKNFDANDIIYAPATAWAMGAIAVIRVSGEGCIDAISPDFKTANRKHSLSERPSSTATYGSLKNLDDCVITIYRGNKSYTGEESLEISCHGGLQTVKEILSYLAQKGFRKAEGGEFTLRAFLHGKMDLTRAEAVNELIKSRGEAGKAMALDRLNGSLYRRIESIRSALLSVMGKIEVQLDYSEDEIGEDLTFPSSEVILCISRIEALVKSFSAGRLYSQGARVVICGRTNAGKSSLFNLFLKQDRAIVSPVKGTTRDFLEAQCTINSIPIRLYDTAGFRDALEAEKLEDGIEKEGIKRSEELVDSADLIIYMTDASEPVDDSFDMSRCIKVLNKADIASEMSFKAPFDSYLRLSVNTGEGFNELCSFLSSKLEEGITLPLSGDPVIENERQKDNLERACSSLKAALDKEEQGLPLDLITVDIQEALEALGEITGEVTTDDILDNIFSNFCVGK